LLGLVQEFAAESIESGRDDQTPDCDEVLLRILADAVRMGQSPTPKEILERARQQDPRMFDKWSAKGAANALKRYSIMTHKSHGRRAYGHVPLAQLRQVQARYNMDLGLAETDGDNDDRNTP